MKTKMKQNTALIINTKSQEWKMHSKVQYEESFFSSQSTSKEAQQQ